MRGKREREKCADGVVLYVRVTKLVLAFFSLVDDLIDCNVT